VRWDVALAQLASQGNLSSRLEVLSAAAGPQVTVGDYRGQAEVRHPALAGGMMKASFDGSARADLGAGNAGGRNRLQFDETTVQATWGLPRLTPWQATFDVAIDRLNVDRYLPAKPATAATPVKSPAPTPVPGPADAPVDLGALRGLDFAGDLKVGALQLHGARLANVRARLQARDGRLSIAPFAADLYEGRASGQLTAVAGTPQRLSVQTTLEGINLQPLLRDAAGQDYLAGRGRVNLDVAATGASVSALKRSLQGTAALGLRDGAVKGFNLAKSLRELKARFGAGDDVVQAASREERTDFSELQASFRIAQGVARNDDLSAKSPFFRISGGGTVDVGEGRLDYLVKANVVNTSTGQDGKGLEHVRGLTVPVRLSGPFDKLSYKFELSQVAKDAAKERLKEKLGEKLGVDPATGGSAKEAAKQRLEEKLDKKLKGLFGR
jgi:AsmA protein